MPCFPGSVGLLTVRPLSFLRNKVVSLRADDDSSTLTVRQILKKLRREQEIFAAAVKLLQETSGRDGKHNQQYRHNNSNKVPVNLQ
jgi:hypothetical protein